ncbi:MAG: hypothetical protein COB29_13325 [Sulfitobacter sp.]|nr:MAG: hypothetical protein COB29_13325 [Sulfitobacter sp.]
MKDTDAAKRLREARISAGYTTQVEFAEKNDIAKSTYSTHESGSRGLTAESAEQYGRILSVSASWLIFGKEPFTINVTSSNNVQPEDINYQAIDVTGAVKAGNWVKIPNWPQEDWKATICPIDDRYPRIKLFCLIVEGDDMDKRYQQGNVLRCLPIKQDPEELIPGKRYIVHRMDDDGLTEVTAKELRSHEDGSLWLWPLSNNPKHQMPLELSDGSVKIHARVVGCSSDE